MEAKYRGVRRFDAAAEFAPEVHLPRYLCAERRPPVILQLVRGVGRRIDRARLVIPDVAAKLLCLRIQFADGDAQRGAGLQHAGAGRHQGQILFVGEMDKPVECLVVVDGPPLLVVPLARFDRRIVRFEIIASKRGARRRKIRPDLASGDRQRQGCRQYVATSRTHAANEIGRILRTEGKPIDHMTIRAGKVLDYRRRHFRNPRDYSKVSK